MGASGSGSGLEQERRDEAEVECYRRRRVKKFFLAILVLVLAAVGYLLFWPVSVDPEAWSPPKALALAGPWAPNDRLAAGEIVAPTLVAPEAVAFDAVGRLYTGTKDGKVVRVEPDGKVGVVATTGGRPLGVKVAPDASVLVADADRGLLRIGPSGAVEVLASEHAGKPFRLADDLDLLPDGRVVFTDASTWDLHHFVMDVVEHRPKGRVLVWNPGTKRTQLVADGLYFPNGIALLPDGSGALVCETTSYRVLKIPLAGDGRGRPEVFVDGLPGFCDNITWSPSRGVFWLAIGSPRDPTLERLARRPFFRKVLARLPRPSLPKARHHAMAVAIAPDGEVKEVLQDASPEGFGPIASVIEHDGALYLGTYVDKGIKRVRLEAQKPH